MCFAKHTFSQPNLGRLDLRPRPNPLFFLKPWVGSSQTVEFGLDPSNPAQLLGQRIVRLVTRLDTFLCKRT
jgi:hypothetical protein